jgi:Spy/CpxP family protein refolding chaperone
LLPGIPARVIQSLNLTDAQKQQARTILQQMRQSAQPLHQQVQEQRQAMAAAVKANDTMKIQQLSSSLGALNGQVLALRSNAMAQFYALLLPDQQAKLDQAGQRLRNRRQGNGGAGSGMGMQGGARQQLRQGQRQGLGRLAF